MDLRRVEREGEGGGVEGVWRECGGCVEGGRHRCSTVLKPPFPAYITDVRTTGTYVHVKLHICTCMHTRTHHVCCCHAHQPYRQTTSSQHNNNQHNMTQYMQVAHLQPDSHYNTLDMYFYHSLAFGYQLPIKHLPSPVLTKSPQSTISGGATGQTG